MTDEIMETATATRVIVDGDDLGFPVFSIYHNPDTDTANYALSMYGSCLTSDQLKEITEAAYKVLTMIADGTLPTDDDLNDEQDNGELKLEDIVIIPKDDEE